MVLLIDQKPGAWLTWKIRELAELLKRIPNDRRRAFAKYLKDAPGATLSDDDTADHAKGVPGVDSRS